MMSIVRNLWNEDQGQDIAEYAVMVAVILVIVVGTIRLVGSNANNVFSSVGNALRPIEIWIESRPTQRSRVRTRCDNRALA